MPILSMPDHVAAAVPSIDAAHARWRDRLGGGVQGGYTNPSGFRFHQYRFRGGAVLELIQDTTPDGSGFVSRFLDRFGTRLHHVTLKVADLPEALTLLEAADLPVVDVDLSDERWQEAFVRPSAIGGLIVQVASSTHTPQDWAAETGFDTAAPAEDGGRLLGPLLQHPDLDRARYVWQALGGQVDEVADHALEVTWPDAPLTVRVRRGEVAGPVGLRFADAQPLPDDPDLGPAVLPG